MIGRSNHIDIYGIDRTIDIKGKPASSVRGSRSAPLRARISPSGFVLQPLRPEACWPHNAESTQAATFVEHVIESYLALTSIIAPNVDQLEMKTKQYWEMGMNDADIIKELRKFYDTSKYGLGYY